MDKQEKGIVIKVNGQERPFMMETPTIEISQTEVSAAQEEEVETYSPVSLKQVKSKKKRSPFVRAVNARIKSAVLSILLAVLVGTSFGFVVLHVIPKAKEPASLSNNSSFISEQPKQEATTTGVASVKPSSQTFSISVIQAGVFSDEKAAQEYTKQLQASGIPAVAVGQNPTAVLIAVGRDKQLLGPLNDLYKQKGKTTYIKSISITQIKNSLQRSLYQKMADLSAMLLGESKVTNEDWTSLQKEYKQFQEESASQDQAAKYMKNSYLSLMAYREQKDESLLWKAQQELLNALKAAK
ncbi:hypothetical protein [Anoxybacteroides tepidamans]|uniref:hypothetical protein n=1 Tax=Anoxybacteroides tepidamans TaxID=265948 RepID=UPI000684BCC7|nr:hypothetical protein [Anoxybacillus tepidamans]